ncbi:MAG TPA: hypothetical protein DEG17_13225 [Cyanobacteria bacterium UBA11149]|nr:hypothetical protein [Cyanobacteria bacterium UBA11367]HBE59489.1 hypothetical protein [Cyanobacteria bacterium UBA11366]HBK65299.1 hypothetical protein [Cyanobacteria bacterium UBA11166]HBR75175.1 hypothetical protein [Cyanobacteria bacterium UBA11159]HBS72148.1 hypothetical protein [Cyanobacteria bacterium UBA11153]HBW89802.1 hypothetical protein [Cyanobacteria bacterium UBA11149]
MTNWIKIRGIVKQGYGVASGKSKDPRFPHGTIAMQKPFFKERGFELDNYFSGTINISIAPHQYQIKKAKHTFRNLKWASEVPAEDFSFFDCRILLNIGKLLDGFIYYPHPETKPEHFQTPDTLEIITSFIGDLQYGDELMIEIDSEQIYLYN